MLPNVQQKTIQPIITKTVAAGSMIYSDEYDIYNEFVHNVRRRGKTLLHSLLATLVAP